MTLSPATAVGFAVVGGAPADARQWITVDMSGFPGAGRRGYAVAAEPVMRSWRGIELANQAREIIVTELRRVHHRGHVRVSGGWPSRVRGRRRARDAVVARYRTGEPGSGDHCHRVATVASSPGGGGPGPFPRRGQR